MKKKWIFLLTFVPRLLHAQIFADGKNLNEISDLEYIAVDFQILGGARVEYSDTQRLIAARVKNEKGEKLVFRNVTVFLNYFYKKDWEFQSASESDRYIFRRRKP